MKQLVNHLSTTYQGRPPKVLCDLLQIVRIPFRLSATTQASIVTALLFVCYVEFFFFSIKGLKINSIELNYFLKDFSNKIFEEKIFFFNKSFFIFLFRVHRLDYLVACFYSFLLFLNNRNHKCIPFNRIKNSPHQ